MTRSDSIAKLAEALSKAQGSIKAAMKDAENPYYKSKYADLASVWEACRLSLAENGLAVIQGAEAESSESVTVTTLLAHVSGEWVESSLSFKPTPRKLKDKEGQATGGEVIDPQAIGSAITYARRYALASMIGVAPEDDDGNAASAAVHEEKTTFDPEKEIIQFGKHKGQTWCMLPRNYLEWLSKGDNQTSRDKADKTIDYLNLNPLDEIFPQTEAKK